MKALIYTQPLGVEIQQRPYPQWREGEQQVIIRIEAAGICGSDLHAFHGKDPRRQPGLVLGHELSGVVVESQSPHFYAGQRVTANPLITCGRCEYCRQGRDNLCLDRHMVGMDRPGAFAEYMAIPAKSVVPLPDTLSMLHAALTEPAATVVHALKLSMRTLSVPLAEAKTLVLGAGAIGLLTALVLKAWGCRDIEVAEINALRRQSAEHHVGCRTSDPLVEKTADNSMEFVIDAVGIAATRNAALNAIKPGGTIMHIGLQGWSSEIDMRKLTLAEVTLAGTYTYTMADFCLTLEMLASGALGDLAWLETRSLEEGQRAFDDLEQQRVASGKVILLP